MSLIFHMLCSLWLGPEVSHQPLFFLTVCLSFSPGTARPPYWQKPVYLLDEEDERNNGYVNDDFIIWMRVSAFATFRNLYRRVERVKQFVNGLPAGNYTFHISYSILSDYPKLLDSYNEMEVDGICIVK